MSDIVHKNTEENIFQTHQLQFIVRNVNLVLVISVLLCCYKIIEFDIVPI